MIRSFALVLAVGLASGCAPAPPATDAERLARIEAMAADLDERFPDVGTVSVAEVGRLLEADSVVLVDVREDRERTVSTIPGAISADEFERDPARYDDVAVVAYCTIGHRSSEWARRFDRPDRPVLNLRGSILAWAHAGGPLVRDDVPTDSLHVYGPAWDLAPTRYETVW